MSKVVTIEFKTQKDYCKCCGQELKETVTSPVKKFDFSPSDFGAWLEEEHWRAEAEDDDSFSSMIEEFTYETISFHAVNSDSNLLIEKSEYDKVKAFCLEHVVAQSHE